MYMILIHFLIHLSSSFQIMNQQISSRNLKLFQINLNSYIEDIPQGFYQTTIQLQAIGSKIPYLIYCKDNIPLDNLFNNGIKQYIESDKYFYKYSYLSSLCLFDSQPALYDESTQSIIIASSTLSINENIFNKFSISKQVNSNLTFYVYSEQKTEYIISIDIQEISQCVNDQAKIKLCIDKNDEISIPINALNVNRVTQFPYESLFSSNYQLLYIRLKENKDFYLQFNTSLPLKFSYGCLFEHNYIPFPKSEKYHSYNIQEIQQIYINKQFINNCISISDHINESIGIQLQPQIIGLLFIDEQSQQQLIKFDNISIDLIYNQQDEDNNLYIYIILGLIFGSLGLITIIIIIILYIKQKRYTRSLQVNQVIRQCKLTKIILIQKDLQPEKSYQEMLIEYPGLIENAQCLICLSEFEKQQLVKLTLCLHLFHIDCLQLWLNRHQTCPYCRQSLSKSQQVSFLGIKQLGEIVNDELNIPQQQMELYTTRRMRMDRLKKRSTPLTTSESPFK